VPVPSSWRQVLLGLAGAAALGYLLGLLRNRASTGSLPYRAPTPADDRRARS
jgi:hypothetical protein